MPAISDIIQTSISATSATPSVPGYGVPLILSQNVPAAFTNRVQLFSSSAAAVTYGYAANHPTVLGLQKAFAQSPRPPLVAVGRRANKTRSIIGEQVPFASRFISSSSTPLAFELVRPAMAAFVPSCGLSFSIASQRALASSLSSPANASAAAPRNAMGCFADRSARARGQAALGS